MTDAVITCARSWIGTRFQHMGRRKKYSNSLGGVDCGGLILGVGEELSFFKASISQYSKFPDEVWVKQMCAEYLDPLSSSDLRPGHIVLMRWGYSAAHMGILGWYHHSLTLIHAHAQSRCVIEQRLNEDWRERVVGVYRYRISQNPEKRVLSNK